jgi:acyl-CoA reductase-like NAD-dependent aldehyde dehydrogenase
LLEYVELTKREAISAAQWRERATALRPPTEPFINGKFVATDAPRRSDISPVDGRVLAEVADCGPLEIDAAVASARKAFDSSVWSALAAKDRKRALLAFADVIEAHSEELALLETLDCGKTISNSFEKDLPKSVNCIRWFAELSDKIDDEIPATRRDALAIVSREALGVIGIITPWNYPLYFALAKASPALAAGNCVVLKPSEYSPLTSLRCAELAVEAGLPPGVLNVVPGSGEKAGQALCRHMDVDAIAFTGSTRVGGLIMQYAGHSNIKKVSLECGGKSPQLVLADCENLERAAAAVAGGIFYNQGEVCNAGSRLIVEQPIREELLERIVLASRRYSPGDPLDPSVQMGALIHQQHMLKVLRHIEIGEREGARLLLGGKRQRPESGGFYIEPTIFDRATNEMQIAREEIFGPVLTVIDAKDAEDAVRIANDSVYGLAAGLWTSNVTKAHRIARQLRAGSVWINSYNVSDITVPFGGFKRSGFGKDKSRHALDKYTELKMTWIELAADEESPSQQTDDVP